jgi:flagellar hook-associated protein 3 FlgL
MRISTYSQNTALLQQIQRNQEQAADHQRQVSTGFKADDYAGLGRDAATVLSAHSLVRRTTAYGEITQQVGARLTLQDSNLGMAGDAVSSLIDTLRTAVNSGNGGGIGQALQGTFGTVAQALNAQYAGQYLFGGAQSDAQPFGATSLADLSDPAKPLASFFTAGGPVPAVTVADGLTIQPGILASDAGQAVMGALKAIGAYDASNPLSGALDDTQKAFLTQQINALSSAVGQITDLRAANGAHQQQIETLQTQQKDTLSAAQSLLDDLENADPATAITKLNQDQTSLQALYKMVDQINQVSLLNFL